MKTVSTDYDRDCPRCGGDTYVLSDGRGRCGRFCDDEDCPWDVIKV